MAWYVELKRRKWYCINGVDMIRLYKRKLYDDWYNALTDEQKQRLEEYRKSEAEKDSRKARAAIQRLLMMNSIIAERLGRI